MAPSTPNSTGPMLTPGDLRRKLRMGQSAFYEHQKAGEFRRFELRHPIGRWKYSAALVDKFLAGESTVSFGRGSRLRQR